MTTTVGVVVIISDIGYLIKYGRGLQPVAACHDSYGLGVVALQQPEIQIL